MIRAAAKNYAFTAPVVTPRELRRGARRAARVERPPVDADAREPRRARRSRTPPATTPRSRAGSREARGLPAAARARVREGARAALRREPPPAGRLLRAGRRAARTCCRWSRQLGGKPLSFNNLLDLDAGRLLLAEFEMPGLRDHQAQQPVRRRGRRRPRSRPTSARSRATRCRRSAASSCLNRARRPASWPRRSTEQFIEVLFARGYDDDALEVLPSTHEHADPRRPRAPRARP